MLLRNFQRFFKNYSTLGQDNLGVDETVFVLYKRHKIYGHCEILHPTLIGIGRNVSGAAPSMSSD